MKSSLLISTLLFSFATPAIASFLTDNLIDGTDYKDIPSAVTLKGRSELYNTDIHQPNYPKVGTVVHSYNHIPVQTPFSGEIPESDVQIPHEFKEFPQRARNAKYTLTYAFIVQGIEPAPKSSPNHIAHPYSLKPQYWAFPDAPRNGPKPIYVRTRSAILKGALGKVEPAYTYVSTLVSIHPISKPGTQNVLSGDSLHLKGIQSTSTVDFYDYTLLDTQKKAGVTYHWLLDPILLGEFKTQLKSSNTFQDLLDNLANKTNGAFDALLKELKYFIGLEKRDPASVNFKPASYPPYVQ